MGSLRRYPPLKLLRKHGPSFKQPMKGLMLSRIQSSKGSTSFEEIKIEEDESFDEFYAKLKDIVNSAFNLGETILEPKIIRKCSDLYLRDFMPRSP